MIIKCLHLDIAHFCIVISSIYVLLVRQLFGIPFAIHIEFHCAFHLQYHLSLWNWIYIFNKICFWDWEIFFFFLNRLIFTFFRILCVYMWVYIKRNWNRIFFCVLLLQKVYVIMLLLFVDKSVSCLRQKFFFIWEEIAV